LERVLYNIGKASLLHLTDVKEDFPEEVRKGLLRPLDVSTKLYGISSLSPKVEKIISILKLTPRYSLEVSEEEVLSASLPDYEAYVDFLEGLLISGDKSTIENVKKEHEEKVLKLRALLKVLETLELAKAKTAETATVAVLSGWLPKKSLKTFIEIVEKSSDGCCVINYEEPKLRRKVHLPEGGVEKEAKREVVNFRFYIPREYVDSVLYALSKIEHSIVDLRSAPRAEFEEEVKPLEPSPKFFNLSSLSSRLDAMLRMLNLRPPEEIKPLCEPLSDKTLSEMDSKVSEIEREVFALSSRLESLKNSIEVFSKLEGSLSVVVVPPSAGMAVNDVKGTVRDVVLQLSDEMNRIHAQLDKIRSERGDYLIEIKKVVEGARLVEEKKLKLLATDNMAIIQVTVAKGDVEKLISLIKEASQNNFTYREVGRPRKIRIRRVKKRLPEAETTQEVKVPSLMENPPWARVYEGLVRGLGTLNYREVDPTVIWFFTFPILFGFMFPDVGHGIILFIFSLLLYYLKRRGYRGGEISSYVVQGAPLLIACAITSIIFGMIFGEFFGNPESPHHPFQYHYGFNPFSSGVLAQFRELALSTLRLPKIHVLEQAGATAVIKLAIYVGIFHITLGLVLSIINKIRLWEYKEAIAGPLLWLWFYLGAGIAFIIYGRRLIEEVFKGSLMTIVLIWLPLMVMIAIRMKFMGIEGFGEALDSFIASLSNTISYARLFAFAIIHAVLSDVFLAVDHGLYEMISVPLVGAIAGTLFFTFFEIVFVFFQALRLHWVEHGTKFLIADGIPFQPFTVKLQWGP
jgi:V/A-type H+-transporting ATPase subunit I